MSAENLVILLPIAPSRLKKAKERKKNKAQKDDNKSIKMKQTLAVNGIQMMIVLTQVIVMKKRPTLLFKQVHHPHQDSSPTLWTMTTTLLLAL